MFKSYCRGQIIWLYDIHARRPWRSWYLAFYDFSYHYSMTAFALASAINMLHYHVYSFHHNETYDLHVVTCKRSFVKNRTAWEGGCWGRDNHWDSPNDRGWSRWIHWHAQWSSHVQDRLGGESERWTQAPLLQELVSLAMETHFRLDVDGYCQLIKHSIPSLPISASWL